MPRMLRCVESGNIAGRIPASPAPTMPSSALKTSEHRREKRHPFHWSVAIVFDSTEERSTFHGITLDLSLIGCSILTDHNIFSPHPVSILLAIPIEHPGGKNKIVEIKARMVYTVLSAGHRQFRCGIHFLEFKTNGRAVLKSAIERRAMTLA